MASFENSASSTFTESVSTGEVHRFALGKIGSGAEVQGLASVRIPPGAMALTHAAIPASFAHRETNQHGRKLFSQPPASLLSCTGAYLLRPRLLVKTLTGRFGTMPAVDRVREYHKRRPVLIAPRVAHEVPPTRIRPLAVLLALGYRQETCDCCTVSHSCRFNFFSGFLQRAE